MAKTNRTYIHDGAGGVAGYIKHWGGRWYAVQIYAGAEWRWGAYADRTQAINAVLVKHQSVMKDDSGVVTVQPSPVLRH